MEKQKLQTKEEAVKAHFSEAEQTAIFAQIPAQKFYGDSHEGDKEDTYSIFEAEENRHDCNTSLIDKLEEVLKVGYDEYDWIADEERAMEVNYHLRKYGDFCDGRLVVNYLQQ